LPECWQSRCRFRRVRQIVFGSDRGRRQKQVEGIRASGGNALHEIRFGLMPQVLPVIAGQVLYFIESNTRPLPSSHRRRRRHRLQLAEQIRVLECRRSRLILMILVAVAAIDWISGKLRLRLSASAPSRKR